MKVKYFVVGVVYFVYILNTKYASAQLDPFSSFCFRFTWLGPTYDNTSTGLNTTCLEYLNGIRAVGVPCRQPFVITFDGTPPDIDYLWEHHSDQVVCRRARGSVCAKFSYSFNDVVQNITYMCTQAYTVGEGATTSGCYSQIIDGQLVEVCLCESGIGYRPCNDSISSKMSIFLFLVIIILNFALNT